ncbi:hypothetical protein KA529_00200 [Candidatus Saccharibacteria bacterium]|jgi:hypothetical protein|nr:hypothetical protein [Candidatus Saccharibacteria bacterium]
MINEILLRLHIFAITCDSSGDAGFFGLPAWYRGLNVVQDGSSESCSLKLGDLTDIWKVAINVVELITRLSAYFAIIMIIIGGITFLISTGEPEKIATARKTILFAVIGLVISLSATVIVGYVANLI